MAFSVRAARANTKGCNASRSRAHATRTDQEKRVNTSKTTRGEVEVAIERDRVGSFRVLTRAIGRSKRAVIG
jgi:hypothetical protein